MSAQPETDEMPRHSVYNDVGTGRDFVLFYDGDLSMEEVVASDLQPIQIASGLPFASAAWSCGCSWYFIIAAEGIMLLNVYTHRGFLCRKKSAAFIELFLSSPHRSGKRKPKSKH